jgi:hypothetical protein
MRQWGRPRDPAEPGAQGSGRAVRRRDGPPLTVITAMASR